jgi:hypothetical protein
VGQAGAHRVAGQHRIAASLCSRRGVLVSLYGWLMVVYVLCCVVAVLLLSLRLIYGCLLVFGIVAVCV